MIIHWKSNKNAKARSQNWLIRGQQFLNNYFSIFVEPPVTPDLPVGVAAAISAELNGVDGSISSGLNGIYAKIEENTGVTGCIDESLNGVDGSISSTLVGIKSNMP